MNVVVNQMLDTIPSISETMVYKKALNKLKEHVGIFNRISVDSNPVVTAGDIVLGFTQLEKLMSAYGHWKESSMTLADDPKQVMDLVEKTVNFVDALQEINHTRSTSCRELADPDALSECITHLLSVKTVLSVNSGDFEVLFSKALHVLEAHLLDILVTVLKVVDPDHVGDMTQLGNAPNEPDTIKLTMHDEVVSWTEEELEQQRRAQAEARRREEDARILAAAKNAIANMAKTILTCYDRLTKSNNLANISLTAETLSLLKNPTTPDECNKCSSLYRFLMALSCSERYMPGEAAPDEDRIMGSFMDIEKDIVSYNRPFPVYLCSPDAYRLTHNDMVDVLDMFQLKDGQLHAQYVDTKKFITSKEPDNNVMKTIHVFKM